MIQPRLINGIPLLFLSFAVPCAIAHRQDDIGRLQSTIEQLNSAVAALRLRVDQLEQTRSAQTSPGKQAPILPTEASPLTTASKPEQPVNATTTDRSATAAPSGRLAFNGEFRLYFDSITRPAGGDAARVSNIRGR